MWMYLFKFTTEKTQIAMVIRKYMLSSQNLTQYNLWAYFKSFNVQKLKSIVDVIVICFPSLPSSGVSQ